MTKNMYEPFWAIWQFMTCSQLMHDKFSKHASPTIMHSDQTTYQTIANAHNNNIKWENDLTVVLPGS